MSPDNEGLAVDAAISAMGWTDQRMIEAGRDLAKIGFKEDSFLTPYQVTAFRQALSGARAALATAPRATEADTARAEEREASDGGLECERNGADEPRSVDRRRNPRPRLPHFDRCRWRLTYEN